ncbi:hypothetical protein B296_00020659 [Ensete ventricosum]|uniref:Uncharacterized protein n=1 Tax=Ensete ventricosum TaxID=4639 RepID=A0A427B170_ENSVE|nr:hypothetical protein B296_00020659 [Ensete ventricosum]
MVTNDGTTGGRRWLLWIRRERCKVRQGERRKMTTQTPMLYICVNAARQLHRHQRKCRARKGLLPSASVPMHIQMQSNTAMHLHGIARQLRRHRYRCRATLSLLCIYVDTDVVIKRHQHKCRASTSASSSSSSPFASHRRSLASSTTVTYSP